MPNWCNNGITLKHKDPAMVQRAQEALASGTLLNEFFPCPAELHEHNSPQRDPELAQRFIVEYGAPDWYDWQVKNWGTKWDVGSDGMLERVDANTLQASFDALAPMGKLVIYGFASMLPKDGRVNWLKLAWDWWRTPRFNPLAMTTSNRSVMAANLSFLSAEAPRLREGMLWLLERFADGRLAPPPVEPFPLVDAAQAHRRIESGQSVGKLVLIP